MGNGLPWCLREHANFLFDQSLLLITDGLFDLHHPLFDAIDDMFDGRLQSLPAIGLLGIERPPISIFMQKYKMRFSKEISFDDLVESIQLEL